MLEFVIIIFFISIFFGLDVSRIKNSKWEGFIHFIESLLLWIIVIPLWFFYERKKIIKKTFDNSLNYNKKSE